MADQKHTQNELSCWEKKAAYEKCFDKWFTKVFLQQKAHGVVGCQEEYAIYTHCYLNELKKNQTLIDGVKSVMRPEVKDRFEAQERNPKI
ncbi:putative mitochondrial distribution/morphology family 35/apoptosis [Plasmopara halstedii]